MSHKDLVATGPSQAVALKSSQAGFIYSSRVALIIRSNQNEVRDQPIQVILGEIQAKGLAVSQKIIRSIYIDLAVN
jgi:hypothetical protein